MSRISRDTLAHIASLPYLTNVSLPKYPDLLIDTKSETFPKNDIVASNRQLCASTFNLEAEELFNQK